MCDKPISYSQGWLFIVTRTYFLNYVVNLIFFFLS